MSLSNGLLKKKSTSAALQPPLHIITVRLLVRIRTRRLGGSRGERAVYRPFLRRQLGRSERRELPLGVCRRGQCLYFADGKDDIAHNDRDM